MKRQNVSERKVEAMIKDSLKKNDKELQSALIKPLWKEYPFSTNGVYFFIGKMGSGKSYEIWKHILMTEQLNGRPYYSVVIYCSTSGRMDKTAEAMLPNIRTRISFVSEDELMDVLTRHLRKKNKYYSIVKHVLSKMKKTDDEMERIIRKHSLEDIEDRITYIADKLAKYGTSDYPFHTLLVLDDFAGNPLLKKTDSPLARILTKTRHYNLTAIIVAQTIRFITLNVKRLATDMIVYSRFSDEDFLAILNQTPNSVNKKRALVEYRGLKGIHDKFVMNITADKYRFEKAE